VHLLLILFPACLALVCAALPRAHMRLAAVLAGATGQLLLVIWSWQPGFGIRPLFFFSLEPLGHLFLTLFSVLFVTTSVYFVGYHRESHISQRGFLACMLALLSAMSALCMSQHLGVMWVCIEAASLASTPLIYFHLNARSLEATWKYLLMNSLGIALALLGIFCFAIATLGIEPHVTLSLSDLVARARDLDITWLRAGFLFTLVGFGTKMGLSPLHSWKPDAYGEAPPHVAALLAGGVTLGAFLGILRVYTVCASAGMGDFAGFWLMVFGLLSIATAAIFVVGNNDYRRIFAYTSVEHMGILAVGIGLGSDGAYASMLHAMHNTFNKGVLFFVAGFFARLYESNRVKDVRGSLHHHPLAGFLFLGGLCATCGLPPFGMFFSELGILFAAAAHAQWWVLGLFSLFLSVVFVGVMTAMLPMVFGPPPERLARDSYSGSRWRSAAMLIPAAILLLAGFGLGVYQPAGVRDALNQAAQTLAPVSAMESTAMAIAPNTEGH
jgi:hydrogenase-4 component F